MASELQAMIEKEPYAFGFFQAVRLLEHLNPHRNPVGHFTPPSTEVVRFGVPPSMAFPGSEIQAFAWHDDAPAEMAVNFMGLTGPSGVLPLYYTELVQARLSEKDPALKDFLDIFHHRLISLFYRAWEKYRFNVGYEKGKAERDQFSLQLLALLGLATPGLQSRQRIPDGSMLYYAGLLMLHSRPAAALKQIIADYFDVNVEIQQFVGSWCTLDRHTQTRLDEADDSSELGFGAIAGDEMWHDQATVRIKIGPLPLDQYIQFLPGGPAHEELRAWTRFFSGDELEFELQLVLKGDQVPECELGAAGEAAPRLGWVTWVKSLPFNDEAADTVQRL
jgi:type VI secretion system protein ImpH